MNPENRRNKDFWSGLGLTVTMALAFGLVLQRLVTVATGPTGPGTGEPAPQFTAETLDGERVELGALQGQVVLLDFWATWCPPCVASLPHLETLHQSYRDQGLVVLGVNQEPDAVASVQSFLRRHDITFPSVKDDQDIAWRYGVHVFPTTVLLGPDQRVLATYRGPPSPDRLEADVRSALGMNPG